MPKRFTDTDKWKKPFIRGLQGAYKLLWLYICDDCDHAGVWQVDIEVAQLRIGEKISEREALKAFGEKVRVLDGGAKWFIPSFIEFQYPSGLNPANKAHGGIIQILKKYNLIEAPSKPLTSPLQGAKDMDMDKDKDKEQGKGVQGEGDELTEMEVGQAMQYVYITAQRDLTEAQIRTYWDAYLIHSQGTIHGGRNRQLQHFRNWLKLQPHEKAGRNNGGKREDYSAPGRVMSDI